MTRDDIVSMVQEVIITDSNRNPLDFRLTTLEQIEHFAALVAERDTALLLAEKLEQQFPLGTAQHYLDGEAAAELRRLHQSEREGWRYAKELEHERKELSALLRQALEAIEERYVGALRDKAITALRERLEGKA
jgi:hypothetical protein